LTNKEIDCIFYLSIKALLRNPSSDASKAE
jgi:hypothetical protein